MLSRWEGGRGRQKNQEVGLRGSSRDQYSYNCIYEFWHVFMRHWSISSTSIKTNQINRISFKMSCRKRERREATSTSSRAFPIVSGKRDCSDTAMQKGGCTWDPGNFITPSQAVSVQDPGLCAGCPGLRTGNMAQTTLCVIATSHRALWYVHLPWLVLQIALMSLPPCLCSLASSHWSSPGCTTAQP